MRVKNGWSVVARYFSSPHSMSPQHVASPMTFDSSLPESFDPAEIPVTELHRYWGAIPLGDGRTRFCVWAPTKSSIDVVYRPGESDAAITRRLHRCPSGYHVGIVENCPPGTTYSFLIDGSGPKRPDPASRFQADGVHGPSEVIESRFDWSDQTWRGIGRDELVIYELHLGAFTDQGTFRSAMDRLDELVDLGVTAIELMPVAASAGRWNWGYDGVAFFAPSENYGTPDDLRRLVDEAHRRGLGVILDIVYNHLGPEGNYWSEFGPYLSDKHQTPWGAPPNFDGEHRLGIRNFFIANAIHWLDEYHLDGLRVDAIHCMADESQPHVVADISDAVARWSETTERQVLLIAESNVYDPEMLQPRNQGGYGFDAQWCDDFLHSMFATLRPGEQLCHRQYDQQSDLSQTLEVGFVYEGTIRNQRGRTDVRTRVDTSGLIYSIQNHDFIGNHPLGRRLHQLTSHDAHRAAAALLMLTPAIPMLFMGEEFACENPFCFFVDFGSPEMQQAVVEGRKREYPQHDWESGVLPTDPDAFRSAKIGRAAHGNEETRRWYKSLIAIRKRWRREGFLCDANLSTHFDAERSRYTLEYENEGKRVGVTVRLDSDSERSPIEVSLAGKNVIANSKPGVLEQLHTNHAIVFEC